MTSVFPLTPLSDPVPLCHLGSIPGMKTIPPYIVLNSLAVMWFNGWISGTTTVERFPVTLT